MGKRQCKACGGEGGMVCPSCMGVGAEKCLNCFGTGVEKSMFNDEWAPAPVNIALKLALGPAQRVLEKRHSSVLYVTVRGNYD